MAGNSNLIIRIDTEKRNKFKDCCFINDSDMTNELIKFIDLYIENTKTID